MDVPDVMCYLRRMANKKISNKNTQHENIHRKNIQHKNKQLRHLVSKAKSVGKKRKGSVVAIASQAKKKAEASAEAIDRILLKLAPGPYAQVLKQIATGKRRIDEERRLALQLGARILDKAKEVRDSLMPRGRNKS